MTSKDIKKEKLGALKVYRCPIKAFIQLNPLMTLIY